jgi:hypothetical protein
LGLFFVFAEEKSQNQRHALAHGLPDKAEAPYRRGDLLEVWSREACDSQDEQSCMFRHWQCGD